ncbi:iron chelate uptake ABC transporter family permease subunit, partial [Pseudomonas aeruginosa]|nr:iron chelate uptake ABC transporter family permease subunit [Pseudomonas aeruginosa]
MAGRRPVIRVGRIAGQYAKPRSKPHEQVGEQTLPVYRGDMVNGREAHAEQRRADPQRILKGYAAARNIMRHLGWDAASGQEANASPVWTSHEMLLLDYELSMLREDEQRRVYLGSTHWPWIGERTRQVDGAHVALLAGAALGVAGALMQALTRNPLAEPGLLGINAGAALAVIVGVALFDLASMGQYLGCAFLGAGLAGIAVFLLGQARETGTNPVRLVLAGAGLSVMLASLTGIIVLNAPPEVFDRFRHWAAGSLSGSGFALLGWPGLAIGAGLAA